MRILSYAVIAMLAVQAFVATPAQALPRAKPLIVEVSSFTNKRISVAALERAFRTCSSARGWKVSRVGPGKLIGKLDVRSKHSIKVMINVNPTSYKISYLDSRNMKYNATTNRIHKRYNSWVANLSNDVKFCLQ